MFIWLGREGYAFWILGTCPPRACTPCHMVGVSLSSRDDQHFLPRAGGELSQLELHAHVNRPCCCDTDPAFACAPSTGGPPPLGHAINIHWHMKMVNVDDGMKT